MAGLRISLIIPTIGRPEDLRDCLVSVRAMDCEHLAQIIIVDDAADVPVTLDVGFPAYVEVRLIRTTRKVGAARCRNIGAVAADGDILAFLDDDSRVHPEWGSILVAELAGERGAVTGPVIGFDQTVVARARQRRYAARYRAYSDGDVVSFMAGGNCAVWRSVFLAAGGFPLQSSMSDRALAAHLQSSGSGCHFVPALVVTHRNSKGLIDALKNALMAGAVCTPSSTIRRDPRPDRQNTDLGAAALNLFLSVLFRVGGLWARIKALRAAAVSRQ